MHDSWHSPMIASQDVTIDSTVKQRSDQRWPRQGFVNVIYQFPRKRELNHLYRCFITPKKNRIVNRNSPGGIDSTLGPNLATNDAVIAYRNIRMDDIMLRTMLLCSVRPVGQSMKLQTPKYEDSTQSDR